MNIKSVDGKWFRSYGQRSIFRIHISEDKFIAYQFTRFDSLSGQSAKKEMVEGDKLYCITDHPEKILVTKVEAQMEDVAIEEPDPKETLWEKDPVAIRFFYKEGAESEVPFEDVPASILVEMRMSFWNLPKGIIRKKAG